jgi:hypothetical protein
LLGFLVCFLFLFLESVFLFFEPPSDVAERDMRDGDEGERRTTGVDGDLEDDVICVNNIGLIVAALRKWDTVLWAGTTGVSTDTGL